MNLKTLQAQLTRIERRRKTLQTRIQVRATKLFTALPGKVGLKTIDALITSLAPYASPRLRSRFASNGAAGPAAAAGRAAPRRRAASVRSKRTRYSPEVKAAVKAALTKGDQTVALISKQYGVSTFSINGWKKSWGLTKSRRKRAKKRAKPHATAVTNKK
jgi:hypothetical protein